MSRGVVLSKNGIREFGGRCDRCALQPGQCVSWSIGVPRPQEPASNSLARTRSASTDGQCKLLAHNNLRHKDCGQHRRRQARPAVMRLNSNLTRPTAPADGRTRCGRVRVVPSGVRAIPRKMRPRGTAALQKTCPSARGLAQKAKIKKYNEAGAVTRPRRWAVGW